MVTHKKVCEHASIVHAHSSCSIHDVKPFVYLFHKGGERKEAKQNIKIQEKLDFIRCLTASYLVIHRIFGWLK